MSEPTAALTGIFVQYVTCIYMREFTLSYKCSKDVGKIYSNMLAVIICGKMNGKLYICQENLAMSTLASNTQQKCNILLSDCKIVPTYAYLHFNRCTVYIALTWKKYNTNREMHTLTPIMLSLSLFQSLCLHPKPKCEISRFMSVSLGMYFWVI